MAEISEIWMDEVAEIDRAAWDKRQKANKAIDAAFAKPRTSFRAFLKSQAGDPILAQVSEPARAVVPTLK